MYNILPCHPLTYNLKALDSVGGEGKYQKRAIYILLFQHLFRAFWLMYYPFLTQPPVFLCKDAETGSYYDCTENTGGCVDRVLSPNSPSSLVNDLGLYCEKNYIRTLASTLFFVGGNIGSTYYAYICDAKGRKTAMFWSYFLGAISLLLLGTVAVGPITYMLCIMLVWGNLNSFCGFSITYAAEISSILT